VDDLVDRSQKMLSPLSILSDAVGRIQKTAGRSFIVHILGLIHKLIKLQGSTLAAALAVRGLRLIRSTICDRQRWHQIVCALPGLSGAFLHRAEGLLSAEEISRQLGLSASASAFRPPGSAPAGISSQKPLAYCTAAIMASTISFGDANSGPSRHHQRPGQHDASPSAH
jgi:hypothetical protein